jgi:hypothetical protein
MVEDVKLGRGGCNSPEIALPRKARSYKPEHILRNQFDLNDVRTFVTAAHAGTLSAAAKTLNPPASTISRSLTRLEKHLGILLVRRSSKGLALTDDCKEYLLSCRRALRTLNDGVTFWRHGARIQVA